MEKNGFDHFRIALCIVVYELLGYIYLKVIKKEHEMNFYQFPAIVTIITSESFSVLL